MDIENSSKNRIVAIIQALESYISELKDLIVEIEKQEALTEQIEEKEKKILSEQAEQ